MTSLIDLLRRNENWLMHRILDYAIDTGYSKYTSTVEEAWRLSIVGLTDSIVSGIEEFSTIPDLSPEDDFASDAVSAFGIEEARRHRERGVSLPMFLGLFKYYRQTYRDLVAEMEPEGSQRDRWLLFIDRIFDRIEIAYCDKWALLEEEEQIEELRHANRQMTNEKNIYYTAFESQGSPAILVDTNWVVRSMNYAAVRLMYPDVSPGASYYKINTPDLPLTAVDQEKNMIGKPLSEVMPWLADTVMDSSKHDDPGNTFQLSPELNGTTFHFEGRLSRMLDVSEKYTGLLISLYNRTKEKKLELERERLLEELQDKLKTIKNLSGLLPICASCKKIRDDDGYWNNVENYIHEHSGAKFSHSVCPDCAKKLYSELIDEDED